MAETRKKRITDRGSVQHISDLRKSWKSVSDRAAAEAKAIVEERIAASRNVTMDAVLKAVDDGCTKTIIVDAMGITRQTLDRWIKEHEERLGGKSEVAAMIKADLPPRFTASDYKFANGGTNVDVLIHDNEGEYEDMRLLPSRYGEGYVWGYRHTSYQWPNKERIPKEVMDLMPQDEFWAFQQCTDEASKRIWLSWTKDERVLATVGKKPAVDEGLAAAEAEVDWA